MLTYSFIQKLNAWLILLNACILGGIMASNISFEHRLAQAQNSVLGATIPVFNKNIVTTDTAFRSTRVFPTQESVQTYLVSIDSPMATFSENGKLGSQIIFEAARGISSAKWNIAPNLNPGLILAYLEKEHSMITKGGFVNQADWLDRTTRAMGYGCPTGGSCSKDYYGFTNQMNWSTYQLEYNYFLALRTDISDPYKISTTIATLDPDSVFLTNASTASNYRYTPHVFWGNYNLWKIKTSNGWGDSSEKYSYQDLDRVSLSGAKIDPDPSTPNIEVAQAEVQPMLDTPPTLGTTSSEVAKLQLFLKQQGFFTHPFISGYYGPITQASLVAFKTSDKYVVKPISEDGCTILKNKTWIKGQTGFDVRRLQECMKDAGFFDFAGGPTGFFGPVTEAGLGRWRSQVIPSPVIVPVVVTPPIVVTICELQKNAAQGWRIGRVGQDVRDLQQCLKNVGVYTWVNGVTGYYGPYTKGLVGTVASSVCESEKSNARTWAIGRVGQDVRDLQQCLKDAGVYTWQFGVTGYFGNYTKGLL